jgi:hypothetical protein
VRLRATFTSQLRQLFIVVYVHSDKTGGRSVAADPLEVVAYCLEKHGNYRIISWSPKGNWKELLHDGEGFVATACLTSDQLMQIAEICQL